MNRNVMQATERLEAAVYRAQVSSQQPRFGEADRERMFGSFFKWVKNEEPKAKPYDADSRERDKWLSNVWKREPHLAGVINSVVSIDSNREWSLTGGRNMVNRFNNILRSAENGEGWRYFQKRNSMAYYTTDLGAVVECGRDGEGGPLRALFNVDPTRCNLTGKPSAPLKYTPADGKEQAWQDEDYMRVVSLPSIDETYNGLGYCAVSRCWELVELMMAVYAHDKEMLGARAPKGLLLLQNVTQRQWEDAMREREKSLTAKERDYYGGVAVLAQMGAEAVDAKLVALSQLPAGFDLKVFTDLLMFGIALCFGYDPIEFWPVEAGSLGRGRETEIQHQKATGKGAAEFVNGFQDRLQRELPPNLLFEFEQRDVAGELSDAAVQKAWAEVYAIYAQSQILDREEIRQLAVQQGIIPAEWTEAEEQAQSDSTGEQRSWLHQESVWRTAFETPAEPIIRRHSTGKVELLAATGYDLIAGNEQHPVARAVYDEVQAPEFRDRWSYRVYVVPQLTEVTPARQVTQRATLFEGDDEATTITEADVARAIENGRKRVGAAFADLLLAE